MSGVRRAHGALLLPPNTAVSPQTCSRCGPSWSSPFLGLSHWPLNEWLHVGPSALKPSSCALELLVGTEGRGC